MIHPMWVEFAKIALCAYLDDDGEPGQSFEDWSATATRTASIIADLMCDEYDKRNQPAASDAPTISAETVARAARIKGATRAGAQ